MTETHKLVITSLVFFNAEFSSPFLIVKTFAFLLSFHSHISSAQRPCPPRPRFWLLSCFYLNASLLAKAMLLLAILTFPSLWSLPCICYRHSVIKHTPVHCPSLLQAQATDELVDHPRTCLDGLAIAVPLGRMTQRRHYANLCLSKSLPPYCCCCHEDQLRNVYINSNAHWGGGTKPNNAGCGKVAGVLQGD